MASRMAPPEPKLPSRRDNASKTGAHDPPLIQSRETGDLVPGTSEADELHLASQKDKANPFAKSWSHLVAGG
jgi:solute carrier family 25 protein 33/36